jgi:hypothetical protein
MGRIASEYLRRAGIGNDASVDGIVVGRSDHERHPGEVSRFVTTLRARSRICAQKIAQTIADPIRDDRNCKTGLGKRFRLSSRDDSSADYERSVAVGPQ